MMSIYMGVGGYDGLIRQRCAFFFFPLLFFLKRHTLSHNLFRDSDNARRDSCVFFFPFLFLKRINRDKVDKSISATMN